MSSNPQGIRNWSKLNDKDRSYLVKLLGIIFVGIIMGFVSGYIYNTQENQSSGFLNLFVLLVTIAGLSYYIKKKFDLSDMTNSQIFRHAIMIGSLSYLFFMVVVFNFVRNDI